MDAHSRMGETAKVVGQMARYIDAEDFVAEVRKISKSPLNEWDTCGVLSALERVPTADVAPIIHAHWGRYNVTAQFYCSNCLDLWQDDIDLEPFDDHFYYCPNCGAKMDEEVE